MTNSRKNLLAPKKFSQPKKVPQRKNILEQVWGLFQNPGPPWLEINRR
jgi:hypothetical protein